MDYKERPVFSATMTIPDKTNPVPPFATAVDCSEGHELVLHSLVANGVKKIFFCGGTDNFYFMESVAKFKALGTPNARSGYCAA